MDTQKIIQFIKEGCLYVLNSTEEYSKRKKMMKAILILVELVDEIPPNITVVITSAALTLYVEKEKDSWSEYHPSVLECIQQISNCLAVCPESMSHLKEECSKLSRFVAALKEEDHTALRREIFDFKDNLVASLPLLEDEHEDEEEEEKEEGEDEESMIIEEEAEKEEKVEVEVSKVSENAKEEKVEVEVSKESEMEDVSDSDSCDQQLLKRVKKSLINPPVASSSRDIWTSDESDDNNSDAAASSEDTTSTKFYSAFGRNPKNRWSAESVNKLLEGVNLYGEGKWSSIYRSFTFPDNINAMKLKDKWRNLVKYNYVKKSGGKYILS